MTTFLAIMGAIITAGAGMTAWLFRKGGPYNPVLPTNDETPMPKPVETPVVPIPSPTAPTLTDLLTYMRDFEGVKKNKQGVPDANWRNNNPLNYRFYDPKGTGTDKEYLVKYRPVKRSSNGFAIFTNYDIGWLYAMNDKKNKIAKHPDWTLYDLINNHAPPEDDNPVDNYVANVAKRLGVDKRFPLKGLVLS